MILLDLIKLKLRMPSAARAALYGGCGCMFAGMVNGQMDPTQATLWTFFAPVIGGFIVSVVGAVRLHFIYRRTGR